MNENAAKENNTVLPPTLNVVNHFKSPCSEQMKKAFNDCWIAIINRAEKQANIL